MSGFGSGLKDLRLIFRTFCPVWSGPESDQYFGHLLRRGRELPKSGADDVVRDGQVEIADRAHDTRVRARLQLAGMPGDDHGETAALVRIGLCVFVRVDQARV